jgi:Spore coat protein Z
MGCRGPQEPPRPVEVVRSNNPRFCTVAQVVHRIDQLQKEALLEESCLGAGDRLGENVFNADLYNTRPFVLYLENGEKFSIRTFDPTNLTSNQALEFNDNNNQVVNQNELNGLLPYYRSSIFRVEQVEGESARLRALKVCNGKLVATCFCVTVELCEFIAIQTFSDTYITNLACIE